MLKSLLDSSKNILVTSHISPDFDAISSALFTTQLLKYNQINATCVLEDSPLQKVSFLYKFNEIIECNLWSWIQKNIPDLIIITDANTFSRVSRTEAAQIEQWVGDHSVPVIIMDHHELSGAYPTPYFLNHGYSSAAEEVYTTLVEEQKLKVYTDFAETLLLGIISDTGRFLYKNTAHRHTFGLVSTLLDVGASIEILQSKISRYGVSEVQILAELLKNTVSTPEYNYSFLSDEYIANLKQSITSIEILSAATGMYSNQYLRSIGSAQYGFIVMQDIARDIGYYKGSFRAINDTVDTSIWANTLGGGGHKAASGFKFEAKNLQTAMQTVIATIKNQA